MGRRTALAALFCAALSLMLSLAGASAPRAQEAGALAAAGMPAFAEPFADWLAGDEETALPRLAASAGQGNLAARLLLWQIALRPELQGPWLMRLPVAERLALLRGPGGEAWLSADQAEAAGGVVALLLAMERPGAGAALALDLAEAGEARAARIAVLRAAARGAPDLAEAAADPRFPSEMGALAGRAPDLPEGHPARALSGAGPGEAALRLWLASAPEAAPLARLCTASCPVEEVAPCLEQALEALGRVEGLWRLGPPAEALIDGAEFAASARGEIVLLRQMLLAVRGSEGRLRQIGSRSACLRDALSAARALY